MTMKRLLKRIAVLFLCVSFTQLAFSQTKVITGTITDDKGAPVQGASVSVKGAKGGTTTDANGAFSLTVGASAKSIVVSSVGYNQQEVAIGDNQTFKVSLAAATQSLNDVVVIGYGTTRKKDVTGSLVSLKAKDFNQGTIYSPDQLLQGKVSGVEITSSNGEPGAATITKIRGNNSLRASDNPLYVLDGTPLDGRTAQAPLDLGVLNVGVQPPDNPLLFINPNDIAQIDVLKDASSTAIFGSRGANGVIMITTKKGRFSSGTHLEVGANWGSTIDYMRKVQLLTASSFNTATAKYLGDSLSNAFNGGKNIDALKDITQSNISQMYSLALSGGNEDGNYRISLLGSNNQGFIKKTNLDRYMANVAGSYKFLDKRLTIDLDLIVAHVGERSPLLGSKAGANGNLFSWALNWNPTQSFTNSSGLYIPTVNSVVNPLAAIDAYSDLSNTNTVLGNIGATVNIIKGLNYKFLYAINEGNGTRNTNVDGWLALQGVQGLGYGAISTSRLTSQTFTQTLNYHTDLAKNLVFDGVIGYEYWKTNYSTSAISASGFNTNLDQATAIPVLYTSIMQGANTQNPMQTFSDPTIEIQSFFARVNFAYLDKLYLTATFRADGSNKFGENNKYGYFPSFGARWVLTNEEFMKSNGLFSNLALRASWGITGNQEFPAGAALEQYAINSYNHVSQSNVANPDLKWEQTTMWDIGVDWGLMNGRIYGTMDYYDKNTTNLLYQSRAIQPAPASNYYINLPANLINTGFEFSAGASIIQKKEFSWDLSFNFALNTNIIKNYNQALVKTGELNGNGLSDAFAQAITNNQPVDVYYLKKFLGFDQAGQQIIEPAPGFTGDPNPSTLFGISTTVRFNKLSLIVNGSGAYGFYIYNNTANAVTNIFSLGKGQNVAANAVNTGESVSSGAAASTRYQEKGDYFKLRNLTINYALGNVGKSITNMNIFVSASNLFEITPYDGFDAEVNVDKNINSFPSRNIDYLGYPTPRIISFGLNFGL
jgi:TonB-dependent starch-binding outer membrane protein SusC